MRRARAVTRGDDRDRSVGPEATVCSPAVRLFRRLDGPARRLHDQLLAQPCELRIGIKRERSRAVMAIAPHRRAVGRRTDQRVARGSYDPRARRDAARVPHVCGGPPDDERPPRGSRARAPTFRRTPRGATAACLSRTWSRPRGRWDGRSWPRVTAGCSRSGIPWPRWPRLAPRSLHALRVRSSSPKRAGRSLHRATSEPRRSASPNGSRA